VAALTRRDAPDQQNQIEPAFFWIAGSFASCAARTGTPQGPATASAGWTSRAWRRATGRRTCAGMSDKTAERVAEYASRTPRHPPASVRPSDMRVPGLAGRAHAFGEAKPQAETTEPRGTRAPHGEKRAERRGSVAGNMPALVCLLCRGSAPEEVETDADAVAQKTRLPSCVFLVCCFFALVLCSGAGAWPVCDGRAAAGPGGPRPGTNAPLVDFPSFITCEVATTTKGVGRAASRRHPSRSSPPDIILGWRAKPVFIRPLPSRSHSHMHARS
jgi:hypothetical protein